MTIRWRGRELDPCRREPQVGNANQDFPDLTPASEAPAEQTRTNWNAVLLGQEIPMIGEDRGTRQDQDSDGCWY